MSIEGGRFTGLPKQDTTFDDENFLNARKGQKKVVHDVRGSQLMGMELLIQTETGPQVVSTEKGKTYKVEQSPTKSNITAARNRVLSGEES